MDIEEETGGAPVEETGARPSINAETSPQDSKPEISEFKIPDEYSDRGWSKNIKSQDDLFKSYDNAQKLIGKKTIGAPEDWENEEQVSEFYGKIRPEDKGAYEFPEGITDEQKEFYSDMFHKNGLHQKQAAALMSEFSEYAAKMNEEAHSKDGYVSIMKDSFGENWTENVKHSLEFLKSNASKEDIKIIDSLPNDALAAVMRMTENVRKNYGVSENDAGASKPGSSKVSSESVDAARQALFDIKKGPHSQEQYKAALDKFIKLSEAKMGIKR